MYLLSDLFSFVLHRLIGYRKHIIIKNLQYAFPDWSMEMIEAQLPSIYKNFTDIILESIKGVAVNPKKIYPRYTFKHTPEFQKSMESKEDIIVFAAHIGNWEWGTITLPKDTGFLVIGLIKPILNKWIHRHIERSRIKTGTMVVSIYGDKSVLHTQHDKPSSIVYIADQNPSDKNKAHQVKLMNRDTLALHGGSEYAFKYPDKSVWYYKIERIKRGYYQVTPILLSQSSSECDSPTSLTQLFFNALDDQINENPSDWLWTHKRWKSQIDYSS